VNKAQSTVLGQYKMGMFDQKELNRELVKVLKDAKADFIHSYQECLQKDTVIVDGVRKNLTVELREQLLQAFKTKLEEEFQYVLQLHYERDFKEVKRRLVTAREKLEKAHVTILARKNHYAKLFTSSQEELAKKRAEAARKHVCEQEGLSNEEAIEKRVADIVNADVDIDVLHPQYQESLAHPAVYGPEAPGAGNAASRTTRSFKRIDSEEIFLVSFRCADS
jgi:hypothetical protein